jgi:hypothetical protein
VIPYSGGFEPKPEEINREVVEIGNKLDLSI